MTIAAGFILAAILCLVGFAGALWLEARVVHRPLPRRVEAHRGGRRRVHPRADAVPGGGSSRPARPLGDGQRVPTR